MAGLLRLVVCVWMASGLSVAHAARPSELQVSLGDIPPELIAKRDISSMGQLLVAIRFPAMFDSEESMRNVHQLLLRKALDVGAMDTGDWESKLAMDWGAQTVVRSSYLALELYHELRERLPPASVGLVPTVLSFDGIQLRQSEAAQSTASTIVVDISAVVVPRDLLMVFDAGCGTCGTFVVPIVTLSFPEFDDPQGPLQLGSRSCAIDRSEANPWDHRNAWERRSTASLSGPRHGLTWLDLVNLTESSDRLEFVMIDGLMCVGQEARTDSDGRTTWRLRSHPRKAGTMDRSGVLQGVLFPVGPAAHMAGALRSVGVENFDIRSTNHYRWGGHLDLILPTILFAIESGQILEKSGQTTAYEREIKRVAAIYGFASHLDSSAEVATLIRKVVQAEAAFTSAVSDRYFQTMYDGPFGENYRRRLVAEEDSRKAINRKFWMSMGMAALAGAAGGAVGAPVFDPSMVTVATKVSEDVKNSTNAMAAQFSKYGNEPFELTMEVASASISVSSASLEEFRSKADGILQRELGCHADHRGGEEPVLQVGCDSMPADGNQ